MKRIRVCIAIVFTTVLLISMSILASAGNFTGGFSSGKQKYYLEYNSMYVTSDVANKAIHRYNGKFLNVALTQSLTLPSKGILVSVGKLSPPSPGDLGITNLSCNGKSVSTDKTWDKAGCIIYSVFAKNGKPVQATITHEVGHALSLSHTQKDNDIMKQGIKNYTALSANDIRWLKSKWG